ncbi:transglutaminase family protein [Diaminobutyricimonas sp. LJ205]|uniref:transglutaminase-like domain-containing protein n=1 Tax=Diaminobutyricimonas sp. LJ205 TaxID=2683590 RepID=UPI0012F51D00|nr:transglutaminase-like domain-containing protein [Diaminobutyricimonas sp. LJ205]
MVTKRPAGLVLTSILMVMVTSAIAAAAWWPIYQSVEFVVMAGITGLVGIAIAVAGSTFRLAAPAVAAITAVVFLAFGVPLAVPSAAAYGILPTLDGLTELATGVVFGWKQLLTIALPVGSYEALLVPPMLLMLSTVVVALSVALRTTYGELGVIAPVLFLLTGLAFGPETAWYPLVLTFGMLAASLLWLIWRRWYRRRASIRALARQSPAASGRPFETVGERFFPGLKSLIGAGVILTVAGVAAGAAVNALPPTSDRTVLRTVTEQPFDPREYVSPLAGFRSYLSEGRADATMLTVAGLPEDARIRVAALDTWDGIVYSVGSDQVSSASGSFTRVPSRIERGDLAGDRASIQVTVGGYEGVWLPSVGALEAVDFDRGAARERFYYNDNSRTGAVIGGLAESSSYRLDVVIPEQPEQSELPSMVPGTAVMPALDQVPEELSTALDEYTAGIDGPGRQLVAMLDGLARDGYVSHGAEGEPASRSGHSANRIAELFTQTPMIGDAEQYATAAALMAREIGFPARVVIGFAPEDSDGGTTMVTGADVSAWLEVHTEQWGWVGIDPTPEVREIPPRQPENATEVARPQSALPPPAKQEEKPDEQTPPQNAPEDPEAFDAFLGVMLTVLRVLGWVLLGLALVSAPFLAIIAAKLRRRRRRRRAADPVQNIRGGWQEFEDTLLDHGIEVPQAATRRELAKIAGGAGARVLAVVADRAVFAPEGPDPSEPGKVWQAVQDLSASLRNRLSRWERFKGRVSLRSFGRYSGRKPLGRSRS